MSRSGWILLAVAAVLAVTAVVVISSRGPSSGLVEADAFAQLQADGVRIVDVRTAAEFAQGHIPGAENVPLSSFADAFPAWDPSQPVALYCATGSRSAEAAQMLSAAGFSTVYDLAGGIITWTGAIEGGPAVASGGTAQPTEVPVMYEFFTDW